MHKYYVKSGSLRVVILGEDERDAIAKALEYATSRGNENSPSVTLDDFFYANERGFSSMDDCCYYWTSRKFLCYFWWIEIRGSQ